MLTERLARGEVGKAEYGEKRRVLKDRAMSSPVILKVSSMIRRLLDLASRIDQFNQSIAGIVRWGLLVNAILIASNAIGRKVFSIASPSAFDLQWQFFAAAALLMAAYTLKRDEHVRIDVFAQWMGKRGLAWLDLLGILFVLLPVCLAIIWVSWPYFVHSFVSGETRGSRESSSVIPAWIIKGLIPAGFFLLAMQGVAEAIRCLAHLAGLQQRNPDPERFASEPENG